METTPPAPDVYHIIDDVPVLHRGRVKPLRVAAREEIQGITGKSKFGVISKDASGHMKLSEKHPGSDIVAGVLLDADAWRAMPWIYVPYIPLREKFNLEGQWASINNIAHSPAIGWMREIVLRKQTSDKEKTILTDWGPNEEKAVDIWGRLNHTEAFLSGQTIALTPLIVDTESAVWALNQSQQTLSAAHGMHRIWHQKLQEILDLPMSREQKLDALHRADIWVHLGDIFMGEDPVLADWPGGDAVRTVSEAWLTALGSKDEAQLITATDNLKSLLYERGEKYVVWRGESAGDGGAEAYPQPSRLAVEMTYEKWHIFMIATLLYLIGGLCAAIGIDRATYSASELQQENRRFSGMFKAGFIIVILGLIVNIIGFGFRYVLSPWGPVTNIYETVVYVAGIVALMGLILTITSKQAIYTVAAGFGGGICALIGEMMPPDLGADISTLQPVLRSKYWLIVHVLTIVASYGAFLMGWLLANIFMVAAWRGKREVTAVEGRLIYRCIQVGVVLAITGTLLGAWWADEAWGRFWGWDPKEVWALILILVYLIPLHLRYTGMVQNTGLAAWSVFGFLSVIYSWYGVNFLLGAGLHSYGFGDGGQEYVLSICFAQMVFTTVVLLLIKKNTAKPAMDTAA